MIKLKENKVKFLIFVAVALIPGLANAHHGSNGQFNHDEEITVSGEITRVRMVNPHSWVYFNVLNQNKEVEEWRCELRAGSLLRRNGWTKTMFAKGTKVAIVGSAARREPHGCYTKTIAFGDGAPIARNAKLSEVESKNVAKAAATLSEGTPDISGHWVALPRRRPPRGNRPNGPRPAGGERPPRGERPARGENAAAHPEGRRPPPGGGQRRRPPRGPRYQQSEAGLAASAGWTREDNPRFQCQATNLFHDWTFDQHVNAIEQGNDKIVIKYGFMDIIRTIHLNMDKHPEVTPSRAGHSIGKWEGDTLVVDTIGFEPGYLAATFAGVKHSDQMHVVERFKKSSDGEFLEREYTVTDPLYLSEPFNGSDRIKKTNAAFDVYECEDLTEEVVKGF